MKISLSEQDLKRIIHLAAHEGWFDEQCNKKYNVPVEKIKFIIDADNSIITELDIGPIA